MPAREGAAPRIDDAAECIWRDGAKIGVPPKAFLVLRRLMERPGQLITKTDLLDTVWPGIAVTETVLNNAVGQLRQALGDDSRKPRYIETVHRRGFRWIGITEDAPPPADAPPDAGTTPDDDLVGRTSSLVALSRALANAASGRRQLVLVTGEPGIGKTSLVDAFVRGLESGAPRVVVARGHSVEAYGVADLHRPVREAIEQLLRVGGDEVVGVFRRDAPSWLAWAGLATPAEVEAIQRGNAFASSETMRAELERAMLAATADRTVVLVLEDLHWSDPAAVALLWSLATRREPARLLIVGTYRTVDAIAQQHPVIRLKHELVARRECVELALEGLAPEAIAMLLDARYPAHELPAWLADHLGDISAGNPLFLLNALSDFEGRGWISAGHDSRWRCSVDRDAVATAVPESTRELIAFRLDQLPRATRQFLETASIIGATFSVQAIAAAEECPGTEVEAALESLARATQFVERGDELPWPNGESGCEYRFRHALYRQVLAKHVAPARRQVAHRRIAAAMENAYGVRSNEVAGALSRHHELAGNVLRAVDHIEILAKQAYARAAAHEAVSMYRHAARLLESGSMDSERHRRLLQILVALGMALGTVHGASSDEAVEVFEQARELGQSLESTPEYVASLSAVIIYKAMTRRPREGLAMARELFAVLKPDADAGTAVIAMGHCLLLTGQLEAAVRHLDEAVRSIESRSPEVMRLGALGYDPASPTMYSLGWALTLTGQFGRGRELIARSLALAEQKVEPFYLTAAVNGAVTVAIMRRDTIEARSFAERALTVDMTSLPMTAEAARATIAWADARETRDPRFVPPLRELCDLVCAGGVLPSIRVCLMLADACLATGHLDEAEEAVERGLHVSDEVRVYDAELVHKRAEILLARAQASGNGALRDDAVRSLERAIEVARGQGALALELRAALELARLWLAEKRHDDARRRIEELLACVEGDAAVPDIRDAHSVLTEISPRD